MLSRHATRRYVGGTAIFAGAPERRPEDLRPWAARFIDTAKALSETAHPLPFPYDGVAVAPHIGSLR